MSDTPNPNVFFRGDDMGIGNFPIKGGKISNQPIDDGGPAFPVAGFQFKNNGNSEGYVLPYEGMTLRDYFAAAALQGNLAGQSIDVGYYEGKDAWDKAAKDAYAVADAMLKAKEAKP